MSSNTAALSAADLRVEESDRPTDPQNTQQRMLTFRDFNQLADAAGDPPDADSRDEADETAEAKEYDLSTLGKWFAAYLPAGQRDEIRTQIHAEVSRDASLDDPVTREEVLRAVKETVLYVQDAAGEDATEKGPISEAVLQASIRKLSIDGPAPVRYTTEDEIDSVVSEFFLDVADRLRGRSEITAALLSNA